MLNNLSGIRPGLITDSERRFNEFFLQTFPPSTFKPAPLLPHTTHITIVCPRDSCFVALTNKVEIIIERFLFANLINLKGT